MWGAGERKNQPGQIIEVSPNSQAGRGALVHRVLLEEGTIFPVLRSYPSICTYTCTHIHILVLLYVLLSPPPKKKKNNRFGVPVVAHRHGQLYSTRTQAGSIPGTALWVKGSCIAAAAV